MNWKSGKTVKGQQWKQTPLIHKWDIYMSSVLFLWIFGCISSVYIMVLIWCNTFEPTDLQVFINYICILSTHITSLSSLQSQPIHWHTSSHFLIILFKCKYRPDVALLETRKKEMSQSSNIVMFIYCFSDCNINLTGVIVIDSAVSFINTFNCKDSKQWWRQVLFSLFLNKTWNTHSLSLSLFSICG